MASAVLAQVRRALAAGVSDVLGIRMAEEDIRLPARGADAASPRALALSADASRWAASLSLHTGRFPAVLGAPLLAQVRAKNGWLLFTLHDRFYDAALAKILRDAPPAAFCDSYAYHRMRMLSRYPACGCPAFPSVQRALLLCLSAAERPTDARRAAAEQALLAMAYPLPPPERQALLRRCGGVAEAACRLLYGNFTERSSTDACNSNGTATPASS